VDAFEDGEWGRKFSTVVATWRRAWTQVIPFFTFLREIRRVIYTTRVIQSVNAQLRKIIKTRGQFPTDDAASKLISLALHNITAGWGTAGHHWKEATNQFAILCAEASSRRSEASCRMQVPGSPRMPQYGCVLSPIKSWVLAMLAPRGCARPRCRRKAANLTRPVRGCLENGRSKPRNRHFDRTKQHGSAGRNVQERKPDEGFASRLNQKRSL
jgi:hypothetical protein